MSLATLLKPRLIELGKIKTGKKSDQVRKSHSGGEYRAPEKLDYFIITTMGRDDNDDLMPNTRLMESLADYADPDGKLRQIPVFTHSDDPEQVMECEWLWYKGQKIAARSDGTTLWVYYDRHKNVWLNTPDVKEWKPEYAALKDGKAAMFKMHTTLNLGIISPESSIGGVYKYRSNSQISATQLYGSLTAIKTAAYGVLSGLPLRLVLRPIQVKPEGRTTTVYVVHLEMVGADLEPFHQHVVNQARASRLAVAAPAPLAITGSVGSPPLLQPPAMAEGEIPEEDPTLQDLPDEPLDVDDEGDGATDDGLPLNFGAPDSAESGSLDALRG